MLTFDFDTKFSGLDKFICFSEVFQVPLETVLTRRIEAGLDMTLTTPHGVE